MSYYTKQTLPPVDNQVAEAYHVNNIDNDVYTAFNQVEQDILGLDAGAEAWATNPEDVPVANGKYSAYHWAQKSEDSAISADADATQTGLDRLQVAADAAQTTADVGQTTADAAQTTADAAQVASDTSDTSGFAIEASNSRDAALVSENKAEQWAEEAEDVEVEVGKYSAHHWAIKAADIVGSGGEIPAGTIMLFAQPSVPTGWSGTGTLSDRMLRVVDNGSGGGIGGSSNPILNDAVVTHTHAAGSASNGSHIHSITVNSDEHTHDYNSSGQLMRQLVSGTSGSYDYAAGTHGVWNQSDLHEDTHSHTASSSPTGSHSHGITIDPPSSTSTWTPKYVDIVVGIKI